MIPEPIHPSLLEETRVTSPKCPSCGGVMGYDPKSNQLLCQYCGYNENLSANNDQIKELAYHEHNGQEEIILLEKEAKKVYHCNSCGANVMVDSDQIKTKCTFCTADGILEEAFEHRMVKPAGIIPFYLGKKEAELKFTQWIGQGWFHPSKLKKAASLDAMQGVYIPFWTFDFHAYAEWCGDAGYHYTDYQRVYLNGKWINQPVTKIRWEYKSGTLQHFFDDILIIASDKIDPKFRTGITGFRLNELVNFDMRYMMGWQSELYNQNLQSSYILAEQIVRDQVRNMCSGQLGGNVQKNLHVSTTLSQQTFKHVYLPIWMSAYQYNGKIYKILINGQTGKIYGDKPWSWIKISILIFIFLFVVFAIWWMRENGFVD
ncbi:MAG: hypothetical protein IPH93_11430 [Saprospiraceae bacterium]|nr:hypothetical protein [Saprospiraceae bacterium]MBK7812202.1 hypothetical protein [Saprospiraceae bacterium]MBK9632580.1 hypothetical protein [Saprospiraceae bacterium]